LSQTHKSLFAFIFWAINIGAQQARRVEVPYAPSSYCMLTIQPQTAVKQLPLINIIKVTPRHRSTFKKVLDTTSS